MLPMGLTVDISSLVELDISTKLSIWLRTQNVIYCIAGDNASTCGERAKHFFQLE